MRTFLCRLKSEVAEYPDYDFVEVVAENRNKARYAYAKDLMMATGVTVDLLRMIQVRVKK